MCIFINIREGSVGFQDLCYISVVTQDCGGLLLIAAALCEGIGLRWHVCNLREC